MKSEWTKYCLGDLYEAHNGLSKGGKYFGSGYPFLTFSTVFKNWFIPDELTDLVQSTEKEQEAYSIRRGDVFVTRTSETIDELGMSSVALKNYPSATYNGFTKRIRPTTDKVLPEFIGYYLRCPFFRNKFKSFSNMTTRASLKNEDLLSMEILLPPFEEQKNIAELLRGIDRIIANNSFCADSLLQQALALYKNMFTNVENSNRRICKAEEYFDVSIGKTPPRKEQQWFTKNNKDVAWISISDMGNCGLYIDRSSEYLTSEAIEKHNVKVVPDNTVMLSFKLTVGRIAISNGEMATNEAIAHFKTNNQSIVEYLYCYLKCFNYKTMGSTSSIATAVNSKIIKAMPFVVPTDDELSEFHNIASSIFLQIKSLQTENEKLTELRDTLLPKLISGELDVSEVNI